MQAQNQDLHYLIGRSFQGLNRLFVLFFEKHIQWTIHKRYFLLSAEIKDSNVMINRRNFFNQPVQDRMFARLSFLQKIL